LSQLQALEVATAELKTILTKQQAIVSKRDKLLAAIEQALSSCRNVVDYMSKEVDEAKTSLANDKPLRWWTRAKHVLNEGGLAPMREALRDQVQALQLLLSVASLYVEFIN
jgi:hypothetical protein